MSRAAVQIRRTCLVLTWLGLAGALCVTGQNLLLRSSDSQIRLSAPSFRFINGKALERLQNGLAVPFDIQVSVYGDNKTIVLWKDFERFTLSYDLWEERFSVTRLRSQRSSAAHLTAQQAEAWCLDRFAIPQQSLPMDRPVYFRVDVFAREPRSEAAEADEPLSLGSLIEFLSRSAKPQHLAHSRIESGAVRVEQIAKTQALP